MCIRRLSKIAIAARPREPEPERRRAQGILGQGGRRGGAGVLRPQKVRRPRCMKSFRDIRVIPVVLVAIFGLAVLKVAGLVIDGGYVFDYQPQSTKRSWAQETFNFPTGKARPRRHHRLGSREAQGGSRSPPRRPRSRRSPRAPWSIPSQTQPVSASERAILERLQARRQELEARAREIDIRESLLKAAEKRVESRGRGIEGRRIADLDRDRAEERSRRRALQGHHHHV